MLKNRNARVALLLTMALLLFVGPVGASALDADQGLVISQTLAIYESANESARAVATASYGEALTILRAEGNWYLVRTDGAAEGYVRRQSLLTDPQYATATVDTPIFAMPSEGALIVETLRAGESLPVLGEWDAFWAVNVNGASGFVRQQDVDYTGVMTHPTARPTAKPTSSPNVENPVARVQYIVVRDTAMRSDASSAAGVTATMVAGSLVTIGKIQNGFGQNVDNGAWLALSDLQVYTPGATIPIETAQPDAMRYIVINDGTSVYDRAITTSDVVDVLSAGTAVTVRQTENGMGLVQYGRMVGWIAMDDLLSMHR